jgi:integrase/recombinase XerD
MRARRPLPQDRVQGLRRARLLPPRAGHHLPAGDFKEQFQAALDAVGIEGRVHAFHDLRHTAITHDAASGSSSIAVMAKAGHPNMSTTRTYLHLAGTVFRQEADRLELRL